MRVRTFTTGLLLAASVTCGSALAQTTSATLEIAGLKLGMTIADATAALQKFDPGIKIVPLYATDSWEQASGSSGGTGEVAINNGPHDPWLRQTKVKLEIGIFAGALWQALGDNDVPVTDDSASVADLSGDFFKLQFTPTDSGGRLYSVGRYTAYSADEAAAAPMAAPTLAGVSAQVTAKFGKASDTSDSTGGIWLFDLRGRQLSGRNSEFRRCAVSTVYDSEVAYQGTTRIQQSVNGYFSEPTEVSLHTYNLAMSGADGSTLSGDDGVNASALFSSLYKIIAPDQTANDPSQYRKCGVEFQDFVRASHDGSRVLGFADEMSDLNALYFDNGIGAYMRQKYPPTAAGAATPARL